MPAEFQRQKRYLSLNDGLMKERTQEGSELRHNSLYNVWLVGVTYRNVEREENGVRKVKGEIIQLHLLDSVDYWILETWSNSAYARAFYQTMQNIYFDLPLTFTTRQKIENGRKKPAMFVSQDGLALKWCYTKDNMQDCPPLTTSTGRDGGVVYDDTLQQIFFAGKIEDWLLPCLSKQANPFPNHPLYLGEFGKGGAVSNLVHNGEGDDLPF
ncbi:hypothetical protein [Chitinophaga sp. CF418]|uniref:hypothetical protein n=1 Tax=Chitinophaga sp. CF418 TaxID=1855287 RepID=UPI0009175890|nr:hypothetical protein [Chitinophaga sp. CF418]SHN42309.1 hypothetical protein SAMN05216311_114174 [Chitinophaga sp. CF418]